MAKRRLDSDLRHPETGEVISLESAAAAREARCGLVAGLLNKWKNEREKKGWRHDAEQTRALEAMLAEDLEQLHRERAKLGTESPGPLFEAGTLELGGEQDEPRPRREKR